jgi:hypothetical protein
MDEETAGTQFALEDLEGDVEERGGKLGILNFNLK